MKKITKQFVLYAVLGSLLIIGILLILYLNCFYDDSCQLTVKKNETTIEVDQTSNEDICPFLFISKIDNKDFYCLHNEIGKHQVKIGLGYIKAEPIKKNKVGVQKINYFINDDVIKVLNISIVDTQKPMINLKQDVYSIDQNTSFSLNDISFDVSDNGTANNELIIEKNGEVNTQVSGTYQVVITCKDKNNNVQTANVSVIVNQKKETFPNESVSSNNKRNSTATENQNKSQKSSVSKNPSQYNQKYELSVNGYNQANARGEQLFNQGLVLSYEIVPKSDGYYLICN